MSDVDTETLAEQVVEELDPGQVIDNKVILSRRQLVAIAGSGLSAGALAALGLEEASAQSGPAGQQGTDSEPNDMFAWDLDIDNVMSHNGDNALIDVAASGSVTLSSGSATVTVESASGSTYYLALGTDDNAKVSGRIFDDGSVQVEIVETDTSVGNPTVNYDVLRVR
jgi:hypothetical protein